MANRASSLLSRAGSAGGGSAGSPKKRQLYIILGTVLAAIVLVGGYFLFKGVGNSATSGTSPLILTPSTTQTTSPLATTTTGLNFGQKDPFVSQVASTTTSAAPTTTTTVLPGGGVTTTTLVSLSTTTTAAASQLALISVSPVGQPAAAQVSVNGTIYSGLTSGQAFSSYTITSINQQTGCATFTNGGGSPFQVCLNQAIVK